MSWAWEQEKQRFFEAFKTCVIDSLKQSKNKTVYMKKAKDGTVFFESFGENYSITTKFLGDNMTFSYKLAVESIYDFAKKNNTIQIVAYEEYAKIKVVED